MCDRAHVLDWSDLRYLWVIARAGSLAGAARELGVEHTTVGRRLSALETALGTRLFLRGPDGLRPTPVCADAMSSLHAIASQIDALERRIAASDTKIEGTVRLTVTESHAPYFLGVVLDLRERHPALVVELLSGNQTYDLLRGEADVAVRMNDVVVPELIVQKIGRAAWSLYASSDYVERSGMTLPSEDLGGHDIVGYDPSFAWPGSGWLEEHGNEGRFVIRSNSLVFAREAAAAGMGITMLPCIIAVDHARLVRLTPTVMGSRPISLVVHKDLAPLARIRVDMDALRAAVERDRTRWTGE